MSDLVRLLKDQHAGLLRGIEDFLPLVRVETLDGSALRQRLGPLGQAVLAHLDLEDGKLYPAARVHGDPEIAALATQYWTSMGNIRDLLEGYLGTWDQEGRIEADPLGFRRETEAVFGFLLRRVEREERDLYPRLDKATEGR